MTLQGLQHVSVASRNEEGWKEKGDLSRDLSIQGRVLRDG